MCLARNEGQMLLSGKVAFDAHAETSDERNENVSRIVTQKKYFDVYV